MFNQRKTIRILAYCILYKQLQKRKMKETDPLRQWKTETFQ